MTTKSQLFYWAACDAPGCEKKTREDENTVYDDVAKLDDQFVSRRFMEGGLEDDYGWLKDGDKHYCGNHTWWDDDNDRRIPDPDGSFRTADLAAYEAQRQARANQTPTLQEVLDAHA